MLTDSLLCAALLAAGRPLTEEEVGRVLGVGKDGVQQAVLSLRQALSRADLGLVVEEVAGGYRLVVAPGLVPSLAELLSPPPLPRLSTAALETLAIIAYRQPVTRGEIEVSRGASCTSTIETLQERELIKSVGRKDVVGKPLLYATTERFLIEFGLRSLAELPTLGEHPAEFLRG
jgi:segregation and condensation protein B